MFCKLCLRERVLQESHYIPRAIFKRLRDTKKNPNPIAITNRLTARTQGQSKDFVLCAECERKLNAGGESEVIRLLGWGNRFPLLNHLRAAERLSEATRFSGSAVGVDTDKLAYFAMSLIWRGGVHEWPLPLGGRSIRLDLGDAADSVRLYLVGEQPFPSGAVVTTHVCTDTLSRDLLLYPEHRIETGACFEVIVLGLAFSVFLEGCAPPGFEELCCVHSTGRLIFLRDCRDRVLRHYRAVECTSKISRQLEREFGGTVAE